MKLENDFIFGCLCISLNQFHMGNGMNALNNFANSKHTYFRAKCSMSENLFTETFFS